MDKKKLFHFIDKAVQSTYGVLGVEVIKPNETGFKELIYKEGDFSYKDSYIGFFSSRGFEIVKFKNQPVWMCSYGGGMIKGKEDLAIETFNFLKKAFLADKSHFQSFRGPHRLTDGDWNYKYKQQGNIDEFSGYEEIYYKDGLVFFHRIIGGLIISKTKTS